MKEKPKTHKTVCVKCGEDIRFNSDDILTEKDVTLAFPDMYTKSVRCPHCKEKNILEHKNTNNKVTKAKIEKL